MSQPQSQRHKRQSRTRQPITSQSFAGPSPAIMPSFGVPNPATAHRRADSHAFSWTGQPGQPGQLFGQPGLAAQPGAPGLAAQPGQPGASMIKPSVALPGAYPFWSTPQPGAPPPPFTPTPQPGGPGGPPSSAPSGKRQRYQVDRSIGLGHPGHASIASMADLAQHAARAPSFVPHPLAGLPENSTLSTPAQPAPMATSPGGSATTPSPLLPYTNRAWTLDSPARSSLGHFPHNSMSLPLTSSPLPRTHVSHPSMSLGPGQLPGGPALPRRSHTHQPHMSISHSGGHARNQSISQRGPPPKAILGGPGGKTFDELKAPTPSRSASLEPPSPVPSALPSPSRSPLRSPLRSGSVSPLKAPSVLSNLSRVSSRNDPFEVKHNGNTVRVSFPPESYSPPDSPVVKTEEPEEVDDDAKSANAGDEGDKPEEPAPERTSRSKAFPWPPTKVRMSPQTIALPFSPTESDISAVEGAVSPEGGSERALSDEEQVWNGRPVKMSVPDEDAWDRLRPLPVPSSPQESNWTTAFDESFAESDRAVTALQEPWPPTRAPTPSDDDQDLPHIPSESPIKGAFTDNESHDGDASDSGTATPSAASPIHSPLMMSPAELPPRARAVRSSAPEPESSPAPSPVRTRPFGNLAANAFLKRSLGGMLRETRRSASTDASDVAQESLLNTSVSSTVSSATQVDTVEPNSAATAKESSLFTPPATHTVVQPEPAVDDEATPLQVGLSLAPEGPQLSFDPEAPAGPDGLQLSLEPEGPEVEEETTAGREEEELKEQPPQKRSKHQSIGSRGSLGGQSDKADGDERRRPVGNFSTNPALRRQLQSFLRADGVMFKPKKVEEVEVEKVEVEEEEGNDAATDISPAAGPTTADTPEPIERVRSPPRAERDAKKLKPTATPFAPPSARQTSSFTSGLKPTAPAFNPASSFTFKPTAPAFTPAASVFTPAAPAFTPAAAPVFTSAFSPQAAPFNPSFSFQPTAPAFQPGGFTPTAHPFQPTAPPFQPGAFHAAGFPSVPAPYVAPFPPVVAPAFVPATQSPVFGAAQQQVLGHKRELSNGTAAANDPNSRFAHNRLSSVHSQHNHHGHHRFSSIHSQASPTRLRPTALPFQPLSTSTPPAAAAAKKLDGSAATGGALGLFTFTHKLRPTAAEWKPTGTPARSVEAKVVAEPETKAEPEVEPEVTAEPEEEAESEAVEEFKTVEEPEEEDAAEEEVVEVTLEDVAAVEDNEVVAEATETAPEVTSEVTEAAEIEDEVMEAIPEVAEAAEVADAAEVTETVSELAEAEAIAVEEPTEAAAEGTDIAHEVTPYAPVADITDAAPQGSEPYTDDMVPHRTIASPRSLADEIERPLSIVPEHAVEDEDEEPRELPRRRHHSARRSSQNSYLSQSFIDTLKSSPVKKDSTEVHIEKSRPLGSSGSRQSSGRRMSVRSVTNDTITEVIEMPVATELEPPMPGSAETFSPIAQLPSDVEGKSVDGAMSTSSTMGGIHMARTSLSAPVRLNPAAQPFIFGATPPSAPPSFYVSSQPANSPSGLDTLYSTPRTEKQDQDQQPAASSSSTMPNIHVEYADDNRFRKWTFPSGPVGVSMYGDYEEHHKRSHSDITDPGQIERSASPAAKLHGLAKDKTPERPSTASDKAAATTTVDVDDWHSHSHWSADGFSQGARGHGSLGLSTRTSAEFPMRPTPPRVQAVVNDDQRPHSGGGGGFMSPTLDDMPLGDDPAPEILHLLHKIDEDMASFKAEVQRQHTAAQDKAALEGLIKEYMPKDMFSGLGEILERQTAVLHEIQRKVDEDTTARTSSVDSEGGDMTLVEAVPSQNDMFKALVAGQDALMVKIAHFTGTQDAVTELRSVTDSLLEAQADARAAKAEAAKSIPNRTEELADLRQKLREAKNDRAKQELADAQRAVDEQKARADRAEAELADVQRSLREEAGKAQRAELKVAVIQSRVEGLEKRANDKAAEEAWRADLRAEIAAATAAAAATYAKSSESEEEARRELKELREFFTQQSAQQEESIRLLKEERDAARAAGELEATEMRNLFIQQIAQQEDAIRTLKEERDAAKTASAMVASYLRGMFAQQHEEGIRLLKEERDAAKAAADLVAGELRHQLVQYAAEQESTIRALKEERDAATALAEQRYAELATMHQDTLAVRDDLVGRFDAFEHTSKAETSADAEKKHLEALARQQDAMTFREVVLNEFATLRGDLQSVTDWELARDAANRVAEERHAELVGMQNATTAFHESLLGRLASFERAQPVSADNQDRAVVDRLAEDRHNEIVGLQKDTTAFHQSLLERLSVLERTPQLGDVDLERAAAERAHLVAEHNKIDALEAQVAQLRIELTAATDLHADLRVELAEAQAGITLEQEKVVRAAEADAAARRNLELQLSGEKARVHYLDSKANKLTTELHETNQNLDVWRSAALEQRLRADQSAVHIAAMQQENYHWREFALGADRDRLHSWLESKPFDGVTNGASNGATPAAAAKHKSHHGHGHVHGQGHKTATTTTTATTSATTPHPLQTSHLPASSSQPHHKFTTSVYNK